MTGLARRFLDLNQERKRQRACCDAQKTLAVAESIGFRNAFRPVPTFPELGRAALNNYGGSSGRRRGLGSRRSWSLVWAMVNEPSVDASSITLTVSAFVEMDMPTTVPKMIMDDLMIMNDLVANSDVTSWFSFWGLLCN